MQLLGILETCICSPDLDAAERFYTTVFGLEVISRVRGRHVFFRCGHGVFLVCVPQESEGGGFGRELIPWEDSKLSEPA